MAEPLTPQEVAALVALEAAVPPGPWHEGRGTGRMIYRGQRRDDDIGRMDTKLLATFVVTTRNLLPRLLARLRDLEER